VKLEAVKVVGFRGLLREDFSLGPLTVFTGEMGTGKTSRLLAILYGLTGQAPGGLSLDEVVHADSEYMWVQLRGTHEGQPVVVERRKTRRSGSAVKVTPETVALPSADRLFIEGRQVATLLTGAPAEKLARLDELLGLARYGEVAAELSPAPVERHIRDLSGRLQEAARLEGSSKRLTETEKALVQLREQLRQQSTLLTNRAPEFLAAEQVQRKAAEVRQQSADLTAKRRLIEDHRAQLAALPAPSPQHAEELREVEARRHAAQTRMTFLEAAIHVLDLHPGEKLEERALCPVCGALITPTALDRFRGYEEELRGLIQQVDELEQLVQAKRREVEGARSAQAQRAFLDGEIARLEIELADAALTAMPEEEVQQAERVLEEHRQLAEEKRRLELEVRSRERELESLRGFLTAVEQSGPPQLRARLARLEEFRDRIQRIKEALVESLAEARTELLSRLKASFKEVFRRVYPYERIRDVDFETRSIRGRDVLVVTAQVNDHWLPAPQLSTGENVALSFALLVATSHMERAPLLLLDEPEEGLDDQGVAGLAAVLKTLAQTTQVVVATRNQEFARLLGDTVKISRPAA
jgi:chromosome segregation protein